MDDGQWMDRLFKAIDGKDAKTFGSFLAPSCRFRFGNVPVVVGKGPIEEFVGGFFASIKSLSHQIAGVWDIPGGKICHGSVSYTRKDNTVLTVPFANIFRTGDEGIAEYLIFADTSQLYRPQ